MYRQADPPASTSWSLWSVHTTRLDGYKELPRLESVCFRLHLDVGQLLRGKPLHKGLFACNAHFHISVKRVFCSFAESQSLQVGCVVLLVLAVSHASRSEFEVLVYGHVGVARTDAHVREWYESTCHLC